MFLFAKLKMYLAAAGAVVVALGVAYLRGRSAEAAAEHEKELNEYVETRKRMDSVGSGDSLDDAHAWLRERQQPKRDL
ncbi:MAG: hypothetical protein CMJ25_11880 [Phycisphaerae bacterium]|nr:hypothetical protein [Phycisphaerae bacterium]|tara:strand:+ start:2795 stop:3028 length:234 start_codon:yes stop_codon:yes gene_type:complete